MPVPPQFERNRAQTLDVDPLRYLRGVLAFFLGGGAVVALVLALSGLAPKGLLLAGLLWTLFGILSGMVDLVLAPLSEFVGGLFTSVGLARPAAAPDKLGALLARAGELAGPLGQPALAAAELEAAQRNADQLSAAEDFRLGLALTDLYERQLRDPGRALGELRRLIDRHPELRQTVPLRRRLAELRARHFAKDTP